VRVEEGDEAAAEGRCVQLEGGPGDCHGDVVRRSPDVV